MFLIPVISHIVKLIPQFVAHFVYTFRSLAPFNGLKRESSNPYSISKANMNPKTNRRIRKPLKSVQFSQVHASARVGSLVVLEGDINLHVFRF